MLAIFQQTMDLTLKGIKWKLVMPHPDNIVVYFSGIENHAEHLRVVLDKFMEIGFVQNSIKCNFSKTGWRVWKVLSVNKKSDQSG